MSLAIPFYVYWLQVGDKTYFEPGSLDTGVPSVLNLFQTAAECDAYKKDVDKFHLGSLVTRCVILDEIWDKLYAMNADSEKHFGTTLTVSLSRMDQNGEVLEIMQLWDANATIH